MMNYYGMMGWGGGFPMMFFGWIIYILLIILLCLGIAALWKFLNKK